MRTVPTLEADDRRDAELQAQHSGVRHRAAGIGDQADDLGEQGHPGRVGHLAYQDVALFYLVELVDGHDDLGNAFDHARRRRQALHLVGGHGLLDVELVGEAPQAQVRHGQLSLGRGAEPGRRPDGIGPIVPAARLTATSDLASKVGSPIR